MEWKTLRRIGVGCMGERLFTDKLVCWSSEGPRGWSLDSAIQALSAQLALEGGSSVVWIRYLRYKRWRFR